MARTRLAAIAFACLAFLFPALLAAAGEVPVTGQVLDAGGKGLPKAVVSLLSVGEVRQLESAGKLEKGAAVMAASGAEGRFRLLAPGPGPWRLAVSAPGFVPVQLDLPFVVAPREIAPFRLGRSATLAVKVLSREGAPLAGVRLAARPVERERFRFGAPIPGTRNAVTGADGTALFERGTDERLEVAAQPPASPAVVKTAEEGAVRLELRAEAGCPRTLAVRDRQGKPVAGARVAGPTFALGETDAAGAFAVFAPCKSILALAVGTAEGASAVVRLAPEPSPAAAAAPVAVALAPPLVLSGRVLAEGTRQPLAGAVVWDNAELARFARSDAKGGYRLVLPAFALPGGNRWLRAVQPDYLEASGTVTAATAGEAAGPTLVLRPIAAVAGKVVDLEGRPVAGAEVRAEEAATVGPMGVRRFELGRQPPLALSDEQGAFRLQLQPGRSYTLRATHARFAPARVPLAGQLAPLATRTGVRIVLGNGAAAFGKVVDRDSRPVAGAEVQLTAAAAETPGLPRSPLPGMSAESYAAAADAQGRFVFDHLPAGRFDLRAKADGYAPLTVRGLTLAEAREPQDLGAVVLSPGAVLEGTVVDAKGRPLAGTTVSAERSQATGGMIVRRIGNQRREASDNETRADAEGRFALRGLAPGEAVDVTARLRGFVTATQSRVEVPREQPLRLVLQLAAQVSGRVVDEVGDPVVGADVSVKETGGGILAMFGQQATTDAEGRFTAEDLAPGKRMVTAEAAGFLESEPRFVELANGKTVDGLELVLKRGSTIEGTVLLPGGVPAAGAQVAIKEDGGANSPGVIVRRFGGTGNATADGDGRYRLEGVAEGPRSIAAQLAGYRQAVRDLDVQRGVNRLDLQLGEGYAISGRVLDTAGKPVADATVLISTNNYFPEGQETSRADGSFRFAGLEGGATRSPRARPAIRAARRRCRSSTPRSTGSRSPSSPAVARSPARCWGSSSARSRTCS